MLEKPNEQSRMDNPEKLATLETHVTRRRKTKQKTQHIHSVITEWCLYITHTFCDHHQIVLI